MSFFDSEIVQSEMKDIQNLQEEVYSNIFTFSHMDEKDKRYHIDCLDKLLDRQQVLYARLSLSEAQAMRNDIMKSASMFGLTKDTDLGMMFSQMKKAITEMKKALDKS